MAVREAAGGDSGLVRGHGRQGEGHSIRQVVVVQRSVVTIVGLRCGMPWNAVAS